MFDREVEIDAEPHQVTNLRAGTTPLFPVAHPYAASNPTVQIGEIVELASQTEVAYPTSHVAIEVSQAALHRDAPAAAGQLFDAIA